MASNEAVKEDRLRLVDRENLVGLLHSGDMDAYYAVKDQLAGVIVDILASDDVARCADMVEVLVEDMDGEAVKNFTEDIAVVIGHEIDPDIVDYLATQYIGACLSQAGPVIDTTKTQEKHEIQDGKVERIDPADPKITLTSSEVNWISEDAHEVRLVRQKSESGQVFFWGNITRLSNRTEAMAAGIERRLIPKIIDKTLRQLKIIVGDNNKSLQAPVGGGIRREGRFKNTSLEVWKVLNIQKNQYRAVVLRGDKELITKDSEGEYDSAPVFLIAAIYDHGYQDGNKDAIYGKNGLLGGPA